MAGSPVKRNVSLPSLCHFTAGYNKKACSAEQIFTDWEGTSTGVPRKCQKLNYFNELLPQIHIDGIDFMRDPIYDRSFKMEE